MLDTSSVLRRSHSGFLLLEPQSGAVLCQKNADQLFIPASNTKIMTLAACLPILGDSLPGLEYTRRGDTLYVRGTADPTFLHPRFEAWQAPYRWLRQAPDSLRLVWVERPLAEARFGPGWAWDDYTEYYQAERSMQPIYGNCAALAKGYIAPDFWRDQLTGQKGDPVRSEHQNTWSDADIAPGDTLVVPFRSSDFLALLQDTLNRPWNKMAALPEMAEWRWHRIRSAPIDTVYRRLMYESDNFVAEQLLLMAALQKTGVGLQKNARFGMEQASRWVDGSGLSRYNLFSPRQIAGVLRSLYLNNPAEKIMSLFPSGGVAGTVSEWYRGANGQAFVFAKTGSMSGVHCLSGYLRTKSGKILIFSFMHNNFVGSNRPWKQEMQRLLEYIHATM
jgi:D-alanyl-D-alanine carboxypeptidase/D-alanyl-D-alanine-endopeptidase (penicillin-binding protein 4)